MNNCWLCDCPLDEDEPQYCTSCELNMAKEMLKEAQHESQA